MNRNGERMYAYTIRSGNARQTVIAAHAVDALIVAMDLFGATARISVRIFDPQRISVRPAKPGAAT
ncbi:MAG: hypothetical protein ACRCV9_16255 [Burkholderiaceae bacterium]